MQSSETLPNSLGLNYKSARTTQRLSSRYTLKARIGMTKIVSNDCPIFHLEILVRGHCLLLKTTPNDSEQHDGNDRNHSQEDPVKIKLTYHAQLCRAGRMFPL